MLQQGRFPRHSGGLERRCAGLAGGRIRARIASRLPNLIAGRLGTSTAGVPSWQTYATRSAGGR